MTEKVQNNAEKKKAKGIALDSGYKISWIIILSFTLLLCGLFIWSYFGEIELLLPSEGMLVSDGGFYTIYSHSDGLLYDVSIKAGDVVQKGDVIARIDQPALVNQIIELKSQMKYISQQKEKALLLAKIEQLQNHLKNESLIISSEQGEVIECVRKGAYIRQGEAVARIARTGDDVKDLVAVLYYPVEQGKTIHPGMICRISPSNIPKEEYGYLNGTIISVSEFSVNEKRISDFTGSEKLAETYAQKIVLEIIVDLQPNASNPSGYSWTSSRGPEMKIETGTLCKAYTIVKVIKPIEMIIPKIKSIF